MIVLVSIIGRIQFAFIDIQSANSCQDVYRWTDTASIKHTTVWSSKLVWTRGEWHHLV